MAYSTGILIPHHRKYLIVSGNNMTPRNYIIIFLFFQFAGCVTHNKSHLPLIAEDKTFKNERKNKLFAFVGKKLEVTELPYEEGTMDGKFYARYKIIQRVYGMYEKDTIEFIAYDHYGIPGFSKFQNVLLFVSEYKGKYYHEKYMYNDVYLTQDGRWAGPYSDDYTHSYNENTTVKPEKIEFKQAVSYPVKIKYSDGEEYEPYYPEPYFKKMGDKAIAVYGNYVEELFKLKKDGVLTARQLFGNRKEELIVQDVELEEIKAPYDEDDLKFIAFWDSLSKSIKQTGWKAIKDISFDSLWACENIYKADRFFNVCYPNLFTSKIIGNFNDTTKLNFTWTEADYPSLTNQVKQSIIKVDKIYRFREVEIKDDAKKDKFIIDFIETSSGYKFYGVDYLDKKKCCR